MTVFISDCNSNIFHVKASMCTNHIVALNRTYIHKSNGNHTFFSMFWVSTFFIAKMPSKHWFSVCILCYSISGLVGFSSLCVTYIYRFTHPIHKNLHFFFTNRNNSVQMLSETGQIEFRAGFKCYGDFEMFIKKLLFRHLYYWHYIVLSTNASINQRFGLENPLLCKRFWN